MVNNSIAYAGIKGKMILEDIGINRGDIRFIADKHYDDIREEYFRDIRARADMINSNLRGWV